MIDAGRTALELRRKLTDLEMELTAWQQATCSGSFRRHHSQVEAVTSTLACAALELRDQFDDPDPGPWILERAGDYDRQILDLHRLWGFFRSKLALRFVPWLEDAMVAADDLAWACYEPAQELIALDARREPPLVYFSGGSSPVLLPRGTPYVVEPLPDGGLREPDFAEAVRAVPVALIGLPWLQIRHLPDGPLVAHEVGHAVEQDLGLAGKVRELVCGAVPEARRDAWGAWASEAFADVYGVLGCGSGFGRALAARLWGHPRVISGEDRQKGRWGDYPPRTTRILLIQAALDHLQIELAPPTIAQGWLDSYEMRPLREYEDDAAGVAVALLDGPYRTGEIARLTDILGWCSRDEDMAARDAQQLLDGAEPDSGGGVRHLMAAARIAYESGPESFDAGKARSIVLGKIAQIPLEKVRAAGGESTPDVTDRTNRDQIAARAISALISRGGTRTDQAGGDDVPA